MKLSYIKLPNEILDINLTANELAVLFYLSSIYTGQADTVRVKQSTIAQKCGFRMTQTVSRITASLSDKGLIVQRRCVYDNNSTGMIYYKLMLPEASKGYFFVQRQILSEQLSPAQLRVYLFVCRCLSPALGCCWNSYNDLAKLIGTSRSKAIELVTQLVQKNVIRKHKIKTRRNRRVYGDNHYTVVRYAAHRPIRRKPHKKIWLPRQSSPYSYSMIMPLAKSHIICINNSTGKEGCQEGNSIKSIKFIFSRGSPQNRRSIYKPRIYLLKRKVNK